MGTRSYSNDLAMEESTALGLMLRIIVVVEVTQHCRVLDHIPEESVKEVCALGIDFMVKEFK